MVCIIGAGSSSWSVEVNVVVGPNEMDFLPDASPLPRSEDLIFRAASAGYPPPATGYLPLAVLLLPKLKSKLAGRINSGTGLIAGSRKELIAALQFNSASLIINLIPKTDSIRFSRSMPPTNATAGSLPASGRSLKFNCRGGIRAECSESTLRGGC